MSDDPLMHELEVQVTAELALAESSWPEVPVVESEAAWQLDEPEAENYETRLRTLRGAVEAAEGEGFGPSMGVTP